MRFARSVADGAPSRAWLATCALAKAAAPLWFGCTRQIQIELNGVPAPLGGSSHLYAITVALIEALINAVRVGITLGAGICAKRFALTVCLGPTTWSTLHGVYAWRRVW